jgi:hypothetical protein
MVISLSGCFSAEILQNLLIKGGLYLNEVSGGDLFSGSLYEYDLSMGTLFDIMSHRPEIFAGFLEPVMRCNILRSKCLQPRHLTACRGLGVTE